MGDIEFLLGKKRREADEALRKSMPELPKTELKIPKRSPMEAYLEDVTYEKQLTGGPDTPVLVSIGMAHRINKE